ncbi:MAG: hypothetical protein U5O39_15030 [Gammaproteobacteria bacterium]|nr:hypothetical protein [Gammaproteobacteria bacterium]
MGAVFQLMVEGNQVEARRVAEFNANIGLPVHLGQMGLGAGDSAAIETLVEGTLAFPFIHNLPVAIDAGVVRQGILDADALGREVADAIGDEAYRRLRT